jgi:hypothetical protein
MKQHKIVLFFPTENKSTRLLQGCMPPDELKYSRKSKLRKLYWDLKKSKYIQDKRNNFHVICEK